MIGFLRGKIEHVTIENIYLDVCGVGYEIFVPNPERYHLYEEVMVHTYLAIRENDVTLYGFITKDEKELFMKLISVKGIGPKSAVSMLSKGSSEGIIEAIETGNLGYLKKLPGIGPKAAGQIILDLKGHLRVDTSVTVKENPVFKEAKEALKGFGFKAQEIDNALSKIQDENIEVSDCIFKALQFLNKK